MSKKVYRINQKVCLSNPKVKKSTNFYAKTYNIAERVETDNKITQTYNDTHTKC